MKAYAWFSVSATQGNYDARKVLYKIKELLTPQDLSKAQALATKYFESNYQHCE